MSRLRTTIAAAVLAAIALIAPSTASASSDRAPDRAVSVMTAFGWDWNG
ncbi:MAG TPA: hypothetical protein VLA55_05865 [Ornithinibacter sp.]|nr:hypothetical protein [Ornithinibacter sp.]